MAKGFKKGGYNPLNFKVVGNPQPVNPRENTIWIDTDEKITSWYFSAEKPNPTSVEIYTEDGLTLGKYLNSSGAETSGSNSNWTVTDKIVLPAETVIVELTASDTGGSNPYHWFYDEAGNPISGVVRQSGTVMYDVPEGAKSIRTTVLSTEDGKSIIAHCHKVEKGMVWISTGAFSSAEFNALKKNSIQVYPLSAKQYVSDAYVEKAAKIFRNGAWQSWIHDLYTDGSEWESAKMAFSTSSYQITLAPTVSKNADGSTLLTYTHNSGEGRSGAWRMKEAQDLTGRNVIKIKLSTSIPSKGISEKIIPRLYVIPVSETTWADNVAAKRGLNTTTVDTLELDISNLEGNYKIGIGFRWNAAWLGAGTTKVTVYDVWME